MDLPRLNPLSRASRWRWLAVAALTVTAGVHAELVPEHLREAPYAGVLFIAMSAAALSAAALLALREHRLAWAGAGALSLGTLLAYLASRSIGLPSLSDDVGDWSNPLGLASLVCEAVVVSLSWAALMQAPLRRVPTFAARQPGGERVL
jgi:hypothetical protein